MAEYILAIDQGTTGSTALILDRDGITKSRVNIEFTQYFPQSGWVEHEPNEIWSSVLSTIQSAIEQANISSHEIAAIGVTNQRETTLAWDRVTGESFGRAIVWQDRRTTEQCAALKARVGFESWVHSKTGLVLDPYFSATKMAYILDTSHEIRRHAEQGNLHIGTVDSFLISKFTNGKSYVTDVTNASRTLLFDLHTQSWSDELCEAFGISKGLLPRIVGCATEVGRTYNVPGLPDGIPITGIAGDQQAALFGQTCFNVGEMKCTYGTGAFVLMNTGAKPVLSKHGLLTTMAWRLSENDAPVFALEGSCFVAGAAVQWLRDGLGIIQSASEIEILARQVPDSGGVAFVPALTGLGAPHWDAHARGLIHGITRGTTKAHIARATLEGIAHQVTDLVEAMRADAQESNVQLEANCMRVDGGASINALLLELQAAYAQTKVERPRDIETTARGAAMLAALGAKIVPSMGMLRTWWQPDCVIKSPKISTISAREIWTRAVERTRV